MYNERTACHRKAATYLWKTYAENHMRSHRTRHPPTRRKSSKQQKKKIQKTPRGIRGKWSRGGDYIYSTSGINVSLCKVHLQFLERLIPGLIQNTFLPNNGGGTSRGLNCWRGTDGPPERLPLKIRGISKNFPSKISVASSSPFLGEVRGCRLISGGKDGGMRW